LTWHGILPVQADIARDGDATSRGTLSLARTRSGEFTSPLGGVPIRSGQVPPPLSAAEIDAFIEHEEFGQLIERRHPG